MTEFVQDQIVTVTFTHNGQIHVVDGFITRTDLHVYTDMSRTWSEHIPVDVPSVLSPREWLIIESPSGDSSAFASVPRVGPDHLANGKDMWVCSTGETISVTVADAAAHARVEKVLSPRRVVAAVAAQIEEHDPVAAERLRSAVDVLIDAAFNRGVDAVEQA